MTEYEKEWFEKDYYAILGVTESASSKEVKSRYRKLARELHPDSNPGDARAEERFKEVSAAYDVIGDDDKRAKYDEVRKMGPIGPMFRGAGGGAPGPGAGQFNVGMDDIGDLLGGLFNRGGRGRGQPGAARGQRGSDIAVDLSLQFDDAVNGLETTITLTSEATCAGCDGMGSAPGTAPSKCESCDGRGIHDENQGLFSFSRPCQSCGGRGSVITSPCTNCRGSGVEVRPREVKVRIPAGVKTGQKVRLKQRGGPGHGGGPPGDLFVHVTVEPHEMFGRSGSDLTVEVPITFAEATLGAKVKVPTLNGEAVKIRIPPGTVSGKTFRLKGRGGTGDLLVTVAVVVPQELSREQRQAVEAFAKATTESPRAHLGL
ncbi:MAG: molecular chaperone DnaJ [Acidimicrobiaceae bacterium]|nr:molecular chaperone DnaJ [Acidimicrobiia bacterium]MCY4493751.1 molecular chaperone DnaJ [Acidimicrobiaceae bacterium]